MVTLHPGSGVYLELGTAKAAGVSSDLSDEEIAMMNPQKVVHRDPEILGGTPVFVGTRVPVKNLFDYLEAGDSLDVFLNEYPSVTHEQAIAALELAKAYVQVNSSESSNQRLKPTPGKERRRCSP